MSTEAMRWVIEQDPAIMLNSDLRAQGDSEKRLIGQALLARLHDDEAPAGHISYMGLAYAGLADDLRPLILATEPFWRRREAMRVIAETGLRELDSELVSLIEATAAAKAPDDYDDEVQLAVGPLTAYVPALGPVPFVYLTRLPGALTGSDES